MSARASWLWLKAAEIVLVAMVFVLPLAFYFQTYDSAMIKITLLQVGTLALAACWVLKGIERGRFEASSMAWPLLAPAVAFAAWTTLRFAFAPYKLAALEGFLRQLLYLAVYCVALLEFGGLDNIRLFARWLLAAAWIACVYGLVQFFGADPLQWAGAFGPRVFSTLANPEMFGLFLATCLPIALTGVLDPEREGFWKIFDALLLVLLAVNLVLTASDEGLASLVVQAGVFMVTAPLLAPSRQTWKAVALAGLVALGATLGARSWSRVRTPTGTVSALEQRLVYDMEFKRNTWAATLDMIALKPLTGWGPGSFFIHYPRFRPTEIFILEGNKHNTETDSPECLILEIGAELGAVGVALFVVLFGTVLGSAALAAWAFRREGALSENSWAAGLTSAVLGCLITAQFGVGSHFVMPGWLLWPLAGLLAGLTLLAGREQTVAVLPLPMRERERRPLAGPVLTGTLALAVFPALWFHSDIEHVRGVYYSKMGHYDKALEHFDQVFPGAPDYVMAQYFMGNALLDADKPEEALKKYAYVETLAPNYVQLQYFEGLAFAKVGDWENAAKAHQAYARLDPLFVKNWVKLAEAARASGDMAKARQSALAAIALEPKQPDHWKLLSQIYMKEKRLTASRKMQNQAAHLSRLYGPKQKGL